MQEIHRIDYQCDVGSVLARGLGEILVRQGDQDHNAYCLREGTLAVFFATSYGDVALATVEAPAMVGEIAAVAGISRTASIRAATTARLSRVPGKSLLAEGRKNPALFVEIIRRLGTDMETINRAIGFYTNALAALERQSLGSAIIAELADPPPQMAEFASAFGSFAREITAKRKQQEELASAALIQQSFLPQASTIGPLPHGSVLEAKMRAAQHVGGDFYDFQVLDEHRLLVIIGDVCGKGMPASLFMAVAITTLRSVALNAPTTGAIAAAANALLSAQNTNSLFATAIVAILDLRLGEATFCNCGHCHLLQLSPDGTMRQHGATGLPLGLYGSISAEMQAVAINPGDTFVFFSDGISEAMNINQQEYGEARLLTCLRKNIALEAGEIIDQVLADVDAFSAGTEQADDITCVVLRISQTWQKSQGQD